MDAIERIREECYKQGIPISKLEKDCGFSNGYIRNLKKGKMPLAKLEKVAERLDVDVEYLLTGERQQVTITIPSDQVAREVAEMLHENPVLLEMLYDFRDIDEAHEQRLKGYYDAIMRIERRDR